MAKLVGRKEICEALGIDEDHLDDLIEKRPDFPYILFNEGTETEEMKFPLEEVKARIRIVKRKKKSVVPPPEVADPFEAPVKPKPKPKTTKK